MSALMFGAATVDPSARTISSNGISRRVSPKAMAVLDALVLAKGDVVSREALLARAWPDVFVGEEVLTQAITELRRAFGDKPHNAQYIKTVPKSGYRLLQMPVEIVAPALVEDAAHNASEPPLESLLAYITATEYLERRGRRNIDDAIELFQEAIACEPDFAPAHAGLSLALAYRQNFYRRTENASHEAIAHAQKAVRLDRMGTEGYAALGYALSQLGDFDHAVTSFHAALRLRTDSYYALQRLGRVLLMQKKYDHATRIFDRAFVLKDDPHAGILSAKARRAAGDQEGAIKRLWRASRSCDRDLKDDPDNLRTLVCKAYSAIDVEGVGPASSLIDRLMHEERPFTYYIIGALARAGEKAMALERLEAIVDNGWSDRAFLMADRDLDPLRSEPRFQKIERLLAA
jgi:DNA-binding winged helix-turn-helix (wHTH) protein/Tfp pilus assembly protein PilF